MHSVPYHSAEDRLGPRGAAATLDPESLERTNRRLSRDLERAQSRIGALLSELAQVVREGRDKDVLLGEADHRLKNALQLAASMLQLQASASPSAQVALKAACARLRMIAQVHAGLHDRTGQVPLQRWLSQVCQAMDLNPAVSLELEIPELRWPSGLATPLGLFVSEAVSNALKHGFAEGQGGRIQVALLEIAPDLWRLSVADDGQGADDPTPGLGMQLLDLFARQLEGELKTGKGLEGRGFGAAVEFPRVARA